MDLYRGGEKDWNTKAVSRGASEKLFRGRPPDEPEEGSD